MLSTVGGVREELSKIRTDYSGLSYYTNSVREELKQVVDSVKGLQEPERH